jgi:hypothetical protein
MFFSWDYTWTIYSFIVILHIYISSLNQFAIHILYVHLAVFAMVFTFYLWCRSVRDNKSWIFAPFAAVSYVYMVTNNVEKSQVFISNINKIPFFLFAFYDFQIE